MRIAVTGSTGFVGSNIATVLSNVGHDVVGLIRKPQSMPWETREVDFSAEESLVKQMHDCQVVVHCAIANDFNRLMQDRPFAYDAFVGMTSRVVRAANQVGAKPIYISTDWVMDGTSHLVVESDPGNPLNIYGYLKALGEQVVRDLAPSNGAICRIGGVMGVHQTKAEGPRSQDVGFGYFVASLVKALQANQSFAVWSGDRVNNIATPSLASEIGAQIDRIVSLDESGTFHLVGDDAIDRFGLAMMVAGIFDLPSDLIHQTEPPESELFPAAVPVDTSLDNRLTKKKLKLGPTSLNDLLMALRRELETGALAPITTHLPRA
jgi:dTDP-4-dehydrorhamnose reductase